MSAAAAGADGETSFEHLEPIFKQFRDEINSDNETKEKIRDVIRELELKGRELLTVLQKSHQNPLKASEDSNAWQQMIATSGRLLEESKPVFQQLASLIAVDEYYRYHDNCRFTMQRFAFLASYFIYLQNDALANPENVANLLGIKIDRKDGFHLDLEDYLCGLLQLASELARYAVNCVAAGDSGRPFKIAGFLNDLDGGFRLLNLKNDNLRKKFDALKYDVQRVENVIYDLTIRGMKPKEGDDNVAITEKKAI